MSWGIAEVGVSGGEADSGTGVLMFMFAGGVVAGDFLPGVDGGVDDNGVEGTLGGGVTGTSAGGVAGASISSLC